MKTYQIVVLIENKWTYFDDKRTKYKSFNEARAERYKWRHRLKWDSVILCCDGRVLAYKDGLDSKAELEAIYAD